MQLTYFNLTNQYISCRQLKRANFSPDLLISPLGSVSTSVSCSGLCAIIAIRLHGEGGSKKIQESKESEDSDSVLIRFSANSAIVPHELSIPSGIPWRIYLTRNARKVVRILIIPRRNTESFLADIPDNLSLSSLCLPGTHETLAFYGAPISQCQKPSTTLPVQLKSGIRVLDIRLAVVNSQLIAYHGPWPERMPFQEVLSVVHSFLTNPTTSRETLVMSIKQEDFSTNSSQLFSGLVHEEILNGPGGRAMWYLQNRIPTLGEVRGKVILFSRFGGDGHGWEGGLEGIGIHPSTWPDSKKQGFSWRCKDTLVRTHDWYNIPSLLAIPEKFSLATEILSHLSSTVSSPSLSISFLSASSFPFALPSMVAKGVGLPRVGIEGMNTRFARFLLDHLAEGQTCTNAAPHDKAHGFEGGDGSPDITLSGWVLMDFYTQPNVDLAPLLVECNHRQRRKKD